MTTPLPLVHRHANLMATRAAGDDSRAIDFVCSTDAIDAYAESVSQDWDLTRYRQNPVVLFCHSAGSGLFGSVDPSDRIPIGRAENVRVEGGKLMARIVLATEDVSPLAEKVYRAIKSGMLNAVSVGFRPNDVREEKRDGRDVLVLSQNELYEISIVDIPANPEAIAVRRQKSIDELRSRARGQVTSTPASLEDDARAIQDDRRERTGDVIPLSDAIMAAARGDTPARAARVRAINADLDAKELAAARARARAADDHAAAFEKRVSAFIAAKAAAGVRVDRSDAMRLVARGADLPPSAA